MKRIALNNSCSSPLPSLARGAGSAHGAARSAVRDRETAIRRAFTLVEMLVAVGLVVLMMSLFATIFQVTTSSLAKQKALAEGDQRIRLAVTLLKADLENRTFRQVCAFLPTGPGPENDALNAISKGYFYIAENDPNNDTDDVLQLTCEVASADDPFYGAAKMLMADGGGSFGGTVPTQNPGAQPGNYWTNQPEFDDGTMGYPNQAGSSRTAEVSWFLRNGTLYRRVLLIRRSPTGGPDQPDNGTLPLSTVPWEQTGNRNFYTDFDYSAYLGAGLTFHGVNDLAPGLFSLQKPQYRFGFNHVAGIPREFVGNDFIGRFTQQETSHTNGAAPYAQFGYPGRTDANARNPYDATLAPPLTYANGAVIEYADGARIGEDIVLSNVLRFDIKVFDEAATLGPDGAWGRVGFDDDGVGGPDDTAAELGWPGSDDGAFVDLGHPGTGFYGVQAFNAANPTGHYFCPAHPTVATQQWRFDTWSYDVDPATDGPDPAPFRPASIVTGTGTTLRAMRAIQIRLTFFDVTSETTRDLTFVVSLKP